MKKVLFAIAIAAMFGFGLTSCDKENGKCYKVTYNAGALGATAEVTVFQWLNEDQVATQKAQYEAQGFTSIVFTVMDGYTNSATCLALGNASEYLQ